MDIIFIEKYNLLMPGFLFAESKNELREHTRQEIYSFYSDRERALFRVRESVELPAGAGRGKAAAGVWVSRVLCPLQREFSTDSARMLVVC